MDITTVGTVSEDEGTFIHFRDAAGELLYDEDGKTKTPVGARVAGSYSDRYRKASKKQKERNIKAARRNEEFTADKLDDSTAEIEAACIIEWTFTANGQPFPITTENWQALAARQPQWQEQVSAAIYDHARFFAKRSVA